MRVARSELGLSRTASDGCCPVRGLVLTTVRALALGRAVGVLWSAGRLARSAFSCRFPFHTFFYNPPPLGGVCWMGGVLRIGATVD